MENAEYFTSNPELIQSVIAKESSFSSAFPVLMSLNWTSLACAHSYLLQDLSILNNKILSSNSPSKIKILITCLLKNILE